MRCDAVLKNDVLCKHSAVQQRRTTAGIAVCYCRRHLKRFEDTKGRHARWAPGSEPEPVLKTG